MHNHTPLAKKSPNPSQRAAAPLRSKAAGTTPSAISELPVISSEAVVPTPNIRERFEELDPLLPLAELVHTLADYEKQRVDPETGQVLTVEAIKLEMPVELRVMVDEAGQVTLKGAPPTQRTATTVLPVFHQMQIRIVEDRYGQ